MSMSDSLSLDPSKKNLYTPVGPAEPQPSPKPKAVALELQTPAPTTWKPPPTSIASIDPSLWPDGLLEKTYLGMRPSIAKGTASDADRKLFGRIEVVLHERQGTAGTKPAAPKTATTMLADSGVTLGQGIEKAHMTTAEVEKYVAEYTAYVASRKNEPKYAALHADAVKTGSAIVAARKAADEQKKVDELRLRVGELAANDKAKQLQVPVPLGITPTALVGNVSIPVATAVDLGLKMTPVVGQLWSALEIATGKTLGGIGMDVPTEDRVVGAVLLVIPYASKVLGAGAKSAEVIVEIAKRTGKSPQEVITLLHRARAIEKDAKLVTEARGLIKAGKPISPEHEAALSRTEGALGVKFRRYQPTVTAQADLPAGYGTTDPYGNVKYSPHGSAKDVALVKHHELVHSVLSPKTLNDLRDVRAGLRMTAYAKSSALRYVEEAAAETYAQVKVNGLSAKSVMTGVKFPVTNGYVKLMPASYSWPLETDPALFRIGVASEVAIGTVVVGGVTYTAVLVEAKVIDQIEKENASKKAEKK